jgi:hypothetical protein
MVCGAAMVMIEALKVRCRYETGHYGLLKKFAGASYKRKKAYNVFVSLCQGSFRQFRLTIAVVVVLLFLVFLIGHPFRTCRFQKYF